MISATMAAMPTAPIATASCQWFCQNDGFARSRV
jgi:hypothetical protein